MTRIRRAGLAALLVITALLGLGVIAVVIDLLTTPWPTGGAQ